MKIIERKKHDPIHILPGDVLSLDLVEKIEGEEVRRERLTDYTFEEPRMVDTSILFELDPDEATELRLDQGIGALIGKEAK